MRSRSIFSCALVAAAMLLAHSHAATEAARDRTGGTVPPGSAGLFPDAEPVLVEKASLRNLLEAVTRHDGDKTGPIVWQLLATMFKAREAGTGPSEYLAAGYRAERLKGTDAATVQNCLLSAWAGAQTLALFTPENLALMARGSAPHATRGLDRGKLIYIDFENLPTVALTTRIAPPKGSLAAGALPEQAPLPAKEPATPPPSIVVRTLDVRLHDRVPLDAYGLHNMDFRLDSIDPHGSVTFLFQDRTGRHAGEVERWGSMGRMNRDMGFFDGASRMTAFAPEAIPDTSRRGVKLLTLPFAAVYLDEDIGLQLNLHLVIRVKSEALLFDQLPPEKRKQYELQIPAP